MASSSIPPPKAVLFDRDGTLVRDVPYNGDPRLVAPMPRAREVLAGLRGRGIATGVLSNQSGIARGLLSRSQVDSVNSRIEALLGPFDVWEICPHGTEDGCGCRKPAPGMILSACRRLGIRAAEAAYIGDIGSDMEAAEAAGLRGILVPTPLTRPQEVEAAPEVAADLSAAVALLLGRAAGGNRR
jgi:HAD superfamily hydrolase (TIGR01662 family)